MIIIVFPDFDYNGSYVAESVGSAGLYIFIFNNLIKRHSI